MSSLISFSQVEAGRQVIGCLGTQQNMEGNWSKACTAGEAVAGTLYRNQSSFTCGFQQPKSSGAISFEMEVAPASCQTSTDGSATIIDITGCSPPYEVAWSNGLEGLSNDRFAPGTYFVTVTSGNCVKEVHFEVGVASESACNLRFFTGFSPNGDNMNDTWKIENIQRPEYASNIIEIFNRWGQSVWEGRNYNNASVVWDGRDKKGRELPAGTYFFVATVAEVLHKGYVEITK